MLPPSASGSDQVAGAVARRVGGTVAGPHHEQHAHGHEQRGQLEPELEGLDEGDRAHAAGAHRCQHDQRDDDGAGPAGRADRGLEGDAGALELREEVEPADGDHQHRAHRPDHAGVEARLGEVGQRVGAGPAQRRGHQHEQHEVAGRPADRVPEHLRAEGQHQAGDAEEGRGGEVLPADGAGVEPRSHGPRRHEEVARRARDPQSPRADDQRRHGHQHDGDDAGQDVGAHSGSPRKYERSEDFRGVRFTRGPRRR